MGFLKMYNAFSKLASCYGLFSLLLLLHQECRAGLDFVHQELIGWFVLVDLM